MKTYTLTENEFHYLTKWSELGKKSKTIAATLGGITIAFLEQAIFSYPSTPIGLGVLWVGIPLSAGLGIFYHLQKNALQDATQTVEQTIKNETVYKDSYR